MNSPCQNISARGLGFVVSLLVRLGINILCACTGGEIQLYHASKHLTHLAGMVCKIGAVELSFIC